MSNTTNNQDTASGCAGIQLLLDQRRLYSLYSLPPTRNDITSPYPQYTADQLNMRRKAEILRYANNRQNTKTNNLTKKEQFALLARGAANQLSQYSIDALAQPALQPYYYGYDVSLPPAGQLLPVGTQVSVTGVGIYPRTFTVAGKSYITNIQFQHNSSLGSIVAIVNPDPKHPVYQVLYTDGTSDQVTWEMVQVIQPHAVNGTCATTNTHLLTNWSTASDVPGSPVLLYLDPSIPLYNYITAVQSSFSSATSSDTSVLKLYTTNELNYVYANLGTMAEPDDIGATVLYQTRNSSIGSIILTNNLTTSTNTTYNFSIPIGIWYIGSIGYGVIDSSNCPDISSNCRQYIAPHYDSSGVYKTFQDQCYRKPPGIFKPTDVMNFHIMTDQDAQGFPAVDLTVTYSGKVVKPITEPTFQTVFHDVSFIPYGVNPTHFYGIQYVGNLNINGLTLGVQPLDVFDLNVQLNYTYNTTLAYQLDYFQTGLFFNLTSINQNAFGGITPSSVPPVPFLLSSFTGYNPGSTTLSQTPYMRDGVRVMAYPNYISITEINGNYQTFNLHRTGTAPGAAFTYYNLTGKSFTDRFLVPSDPSSGFVSTYTYSLTPIYNHMYGMSEPVPPISLPPLTIRAAVDTTQITTNRIPLVNISGNYTSFNLQRYIVGRTTSPVLLTNLTGTHYTDVSLVAGMTYRYVLTPIFTDPGGNRLVGRTYTLPGTYTTHNVYIRGTFGAVRPFSVEIRGISGEFDTFSVIRDGLPTRIFYDLSAGSHSYISTDPSGFFIFKDTGPGLTPGSSYTYSFLPTRNGIDGVRTYMSPRPVKLPLVSATAKLGAITATAVQIVDISGYFDQVTLTRSGNPTQSYTLLNSTDTSFVDTGNGLTPGNIYSYSVLPSLQGTTGQSYVLSPANIRIPLP